MKVASLHGEMSKMERQQVLAKFRAGGYRAMVRCSLETPVMPSLSANRVSLARLGLLLAHVTSRHGAVAGADHVALSTSMQEGYCSATFAMVVIRQQIFQMQCLTAQIVSDMAARGLDIEDCDAVLNLELPSNASAYAHRAGRTGRLGRCA